MFSCEYCEIFENSFLHSFLHVCGDDRGRGGRGQNLSINPPTVVIPHCLMLWGNRSGGRGVKIIFLRKHPFIVMVIYKAQKQLTTKNTVISPNFLVWKFCGKAQFPHSFMANHPKLYGNCTFPQNFYTRK